MIMKVSAGEGYDVVVERGALDSVEKYFDLDRKVLVVTDDGVPASYSEAVAKKCKFPVRVCLESGEESKNFDVFKHLLSVMLKNGFTRKDCVVAVGGGVVGDISAFAASCYMRGIDFYNVPTTLLSQLDSSIGGKTAIDFEGVKNVVGTFYQPKKVLVDVATLDTLDERQLHAGLAEGIKMACTSSRSFFDLIKNSTNLKADIEEIIVKSLEIKRAVVEEDTKEAGLRKILNFGHTVGHAIESAEKGNLLHGECVSIGMTYLCSDSVKKELVGVLEKYSLPTTTDLKGDELIEYISHDKKADGKKITVVIVDEIGTYRFEKRNAEEVLKGEQK